jgi:uncharacterized phage protein gp47/JayE
VPITDTSMYRRREDVLAEMLADLVAAVPDAYVGIDGNIRFIFEIDAGQLENLYLAHQLLLEDIFITTASSAALQRHGEVYGLAMKNGTKSVGTLTFEGDGGTYIPIGTEVGYDPGNGLDVIFFNTTTDGTIPNPGDPAAPAVAINAVAGNLNGTYEYVVTFVTASGETLPSDESVAINPVNQQASLTAIPVGGVGTTARRIYRAKNGSGIYRRITEIAGNVVVVFNDNVTDATMNGGALVPSVDTAHQITVNGESQATGVEGNAAIGTVTALTNAPATLQDVTNPTAFTGGSDPEDTEDFRTRLLEYVQSPGTGSPSDLKAWAEAVDGVETATIFPNTPAVGQTTIRISAPGGAVPSAQVIANTQAALDQKEIANLTVIVQSFNPQPTAVTVDVTTLGTYVLADVTPSVQAAIQDYINSLAVGETLRISGIIDAVFGLAGIADVVVTVPAANQATAATDKRTPGVITVT